MLTCLALVAFNVASLSDIPKMSSDLEAEARALATVNEISSDFVSRIETFSADAQRLSASLGSAGVGQDMPCIFQGIASDAHARATDFVAADTQAAQDTAFMNFRVLMEDAAMLAPLAAGAAAERADERNIALR
ncbi:MAG: hypothetical protein KF779_07820 [Hyphomonadaceae bacterium]|nr:hypothetical protein [Hyphomonadaceae bacterium]